MPLGRRPGRGEHCTGRAQQQQVSAPRELLEGSTQTKGRRRCDRTSQAKSSTTTRQKRNGTEKKKKEYNRLGCVGCWLTTRDGGEKMAALRITTSPQTKDNQAPRSCQLGAATGDVLEKPRRPMILSRERRRAGGHCLSDRTAKGAELLRHRDGDLPLGAGQAAEQSTRRRAPVPQVRARTGRKSSTPQPCPWGNKRKHRASASWCTER